MLFLGRHAFPSLFDQQVGVWGEWTTEDGNCRRQPTGASSSLTSHKRVLSVVLLHSSRFVNSARQVGLVCGVHVAPCCCYLLVPCVLTTQCQVLGSSAVGAIVRSHTHSVHTA